jgi:hypothetical protein
LDKGEYDLSCRHKVRALRGAVLEKLLVSLALAPFQKILEYRQVPWCSVATIFQINELSETRIAGDLQGWDKESFDCTGVVRFI